MAERTVRLDVRFIDPRKDVITDDDLYEMTTRMEIEFNKNMHTRAHVHFHKPEGEDVH